MNFKNVIKFNLKITPENEKVEFEGVFFTNIAYILVNIDGHELLSLESFEGSFIVLVELEKSTLGSGNYLIFTSISGVADDSGWEKIKVIHEQDVVRWFIERDDNEFVFSFDKSEYFNGVIELRKKIEILNSNIVLEPSHVIFPE
jgi:hypothetical protein